MISVIRVVLLLLIYFSSIFLQFLRVPRTPSALRNNQFVRNWTEDNNSKKRWFITPPEYILYENIIKKNVVKVWNYIARYFLYTWGNRVSRVYLPTIILSALVKKIVCLLRFITVYDSFGVGTILSSFSTFRTINRFYCGGESSAYFSRGEKIATQKFRALGRNAHCADFNENFSKC